MNRASLGVQSLSDRTGCEIYGKAEFLNPGGSVKDRAAKGIIADAERRGVLKPGGAFVGKVFQGGASGALLARVKSLFRDVKHVKPPASRAESVELYLVATGFRGNS